MQASLKSRIAALRLDIDCRVRQLRQENLLKPDTPAWMQRVMMSIFHIESKKKELFTCEERLQNLLRAKRASQKKRYRQLRTRRTLEEVSDKLTKWVECRATRLF
jgi:hypothetical protein